MGGFIFLTKFSSVFTKLINSCGQCDEETSNLVVFQLFAAENNNVRFWTFWCHILTPVESIPFLHETIYETVIICLDRFFALSFHHTDKNFEFLSKPTDFSSLFLHLTLANLWVELSSLYHNWLLRILDLNLNLNYFLNLLIHRFRSRSCRSQHLYGLLRNFVATRADNCSCKVEFVSQLLVVFHCFRSSLWQALMLVSLIRNTIRFRYLDDIFGTRFLQLACELVWLFSMLLILLWRF